MQVATADSEDEDEDENEVSVSSDVIDDNDDEISVRSTKRPTIQPYQSKGKRIKKEQREDALLEKAISYLDTTTKSENVKDDEYDLFGKHIAMELKGIDNIAARRWAKLQFQMIIFQAQTGMVGTSSPMSNYPPLYREQGSRSESVASFNDEY